MVNNKTFELFASLWACSRTGLCALCCLSIAPNELSLNEHPGTGLGAGNAKKMVIHSLPFVMTWLFGCLIVAQGRGQICLGERVYFISVLSKQRSQGGRDVRQLS